MNTNQIHEVLTKLIPKQVNFLGVFAQNQIPLIDSSFSFPLCFVSNTHPSGKPGEHWVAFYYNSPSALQFFDSYGLPPSIYGFTHKPLRINTKSLQSIDSDVCGQYCIFYLYHRSRGKSLSQIFRSFSTQDQAWNDNSVARFVSTHYLSSSLRSSTSQFSLKRKSCNK